MTNAPVVRIAMDSHARAPAITSVRPWGAEIKRILCVRLDNLGDVLMTTPALHALRTSAPAAPATAMVRSFELLS